MKETNYTLEEFAEAVKASGSISQVLIKLNLKPSGANYKGFYDKISQLNLSIDHFTGQAFNKGRIFGTSRKHRTIEEILVKGSKVTTSAFKERLIKAKILEYKCKICDNSEWNGKELTLHLDHINGENTDNRLENLRLLCPNCHSQTDTYAGRNIKRKYLKNKCKKCETLISSKHSFCQMCFKQTQYVKVRNELKEIAKNQLAIEKPCIDCGESFIALSDRCKKCRGKVAQPTKIQWPSKEELQKLIWEIPSIQIGKNLGVSDKAIEKRCKKLGITKPPRGYWAKQKHISQ